MRVILPIHPYFATRSEWLSQVKQVFGNPSEIAWLALLSAGCFESFVEYVDHHHDALLEEMTERETGLDQYEYMRKLSLTNDSYYALSLEVFHHMQTTLFLNLLGEKLFDPPMLIVDVPLPDILIVQYD